MSRSPSVRRPGVVALLAAAVLVLGPAAPAVPVTGPATTAGPAVHEAHEGSSEARSAAPRRYYVDPTSPAALAGREFRRIGEQAQARWFEPGAYASPEAVEAAVADHTSRADRAGRRALLVVYGIPGRDCGGQSSGGLPDAASYAAWVRGIADGLRGRRPMVVLEPDAVAFMTDAGCAGAAARQRMLDDAVRVLERAGAWVYLDGGHSAWASPEAMAPLLVASGVARARGVATNVSNFRRTPDEQRYARAVLAAVRDEGVRPRLHYLVDSSRNGARHPVTGDWCNPTWARLGDPGRLRLRGAFDGTAWVKPPGESDGSCAGGPPAGAWWPDGARRLLGRA